MEDTRLSNEIAEIVVAAISELKGLNHETIRLDSTFEELKMDSLDGLDLFFKLEEEFDLTIPDERARSLRTVRDVVEEIAKLTSEQKINTPAST
jgi:acyl carrier protein